MNENEWKNKKPLIFVDLILQNIKHNNERDCEKERNSTPPETQDKTSLHVSPVSSTPPHSATPPSGCTLKEISIYTPSMFSQFPFLGIYS